MKTLTQKLKSAGKKAIVGTLFLGQLLWSACNDIPIKPAQLEAKEESFYNWHYLLKTENDQKRNKKCTEKKMSPNEAIETINFLTGSLENPYSEYLQEREFILDPCVMSLVNQERSLGFFAPHGLKYSIERVPLIYLLYFSKCLKNSINAPKLFEALASLDEAIYVRSNIKNEREFRYILSHERFHKFFRQLNGIEKKPLCEAAERIKTEGIKGGIVTIPADVRKSEEYEHLFRECGNEFYTSLAFNQLSDYLPPSKSNDISNNTYNIRHLLSGSDDLNYTTKESLRKKYPKAYKTFEQLRKKSTVHQRR